MARGRKKLEIDRDVFQRVVSKLEENQTFPNTSALWKAVEGTDWAMQQSPRPLTAQVAYMRARELGIVTKTLPGKRGGTMTEERIANMRSARSGRKPRAEKMRVFAPTFKEMRATYPTNLSATIDRAEKGSLRAAITLKCLECCAFQRVEVRNCACPGCSLYPHRPGANELNNIGGTCNCDAKTEEIPVELPVAA